MTSVQSTMMSFLRLLFCKRRKQPTLPASAVAPIQRVPYVLSGYRLSYQPWRYYFLSLFHVHNETVNVWTHLIGLCVLLHRFCYYLEIYNHNDKHSWPLLAHIVCCMIAIFKSSTVHLLHSRSEYWNVVGFIVDYTGVLFYMFGTNLIGFYSVSDKRVYYVLHRFFMPALTFLTYLNFVNLCVAKIRYGTEPRRKRVMFLVGLSTQALTCVCFFLPRYFTCFADENCSMSSMNDITICLILFLSQAVTFGMHQPERSWPGRFDIIGHSHQIFHVLAIITMVMQMIAVHHENVHKTNVHAEPDLIEIVICMMVLYVAEIVTIVYIAKFVIKKTL